MPLKLSTVGATTSTKTSSRVRAVQPVFSIAAAQ